MPAAWRAVRTATRSVASETTSKDSPRSWTSSAPASSAASSTSSSVTVLPSWAAGTSTTPLRLKRNDTEPGSASEPPLRVMAVRTSMAARFLLSVRHSMSIATPAGP